MRYLLDEQRKQVGFEYIINKLNVSSPYGINEIKNLKAFSDIETLNDELTLVEKTIDKIKEYPQEFSEIDRIFMIMKDIKNSIKKCKESSNLILDEIELFEIKMFSMAVQNLSTYYYKTGGIDGIQFKSLEGLVKLLDPDNTQIPTFFIYDSYSESLKEARENKKRVESQIFSALDKEEIEILKSKRLEFVILEDEEEIKVKKFLTSEITSYVEDLLYNIAVVGKLDFLIAKSKLFIEENAVRPTITDNCAMDIKIVDAINVEIKHIIASKGKKFTPVSINLKSGVSIITGANMGGKSVSLKTIVQNLLLAQFGFFVFAKEAVIPLLDFIFYISEDMQSIQKGLSTFGAEIVKMKPVIELAKRCDGFIALDEFARGTNPQEGKIIVKSLSEYMNNFNSVTVISTHYDGVITDDMEHYQVIGLRDLDFNSLKHKIDLNKSKSVEIIQEHMDYRLEKVEDIKEVPKDALHIAELLGFEKEILDIAKQMY